VFIFKPIWRNDPILTNILSKGLVQPPTSKATGKLKSENSKICVWVIVSNIEFGIAKRETYGRLTLVSIQPPATDLVFTPLP